MTRSTIWPDGASRISSRPSPRSTTVSMPHPQPSSRCWPEKTSDRSWSVLVPTPPDDQAALKPNRTGSWWQTRHSYLPLSQGSLHSIWLGHNGFTPSLQRISTVHDDSRRVLGAHIGDLSHAGSPWPCSGPSA